MLNLSRIVLPTAPSSSPRKSYTLNMVPNLRLYTIKAHLNALHLFQINILNAPNVSFRGPSQAPGNGEVETVRVISMLTVMCQRTGPRITRGRIERWLIEARQGAI